jgi:hypothetical protein
VENQPKSMLGTLTLSGIILALSFALSWLGLFPKGITGSLVFVGVLVCVVILASLELAGIIRTAKEAKGCSLIALGLGLILLTVVGLAAWSAIRHPPAPPPTGAKPDNG